MRAVALSGDGHLEVVDKPEPEPGPGEVVISVERCGICGSDLHLKDSGLLPLGAVMGHEFSGTVASRGDGVGSDLPEGWRVAVLPAGRCGRCDQCTAGRSQLCAAQPLTAIGLGVNDGAFAERVKAPAASCFPLPAGMTPEQGALVEPYAVGLHAVARSRVATGTDGDPAVGILGAGPIGVMCLAALRSAGLRQVVVAEPDERRAAAAQAMGATVVSRARQMARALGGPPGVVFDAAGTAGSPALALETAAPGGQVVLVGATGPGQMAPMPSLLWVVKEVDVVAAIAYTTEEFGEAVKAVASSAFSSDLVVSDVRPLDAADRSFDELSRPGRPLKVLLAP